MYLTLPAAPGQAQGRNAQADRLYAGRADLAKARQAADLWRADLAANPKDFEAAWKLSRVDYWIATHLPVGDEARQQFNAGIAAGQQAEQLEPNRPEGHFWVAANMGELAESYGLRAGMKYRKPIKAELETVLRLDPAYHGGAADRGLGRWYDKVPRLFGGSEKLAEAHLKKSLDYDANSPITHYFLAELYLDQGRKPDARAELQKVIAAKPDPDDPAEAADYKQKAETLLAKIG